MNNQQNNHLGWHTGGPAAAGTVSATHQPPEVDFIANTVQQKK